MVEQVDNPANYHMHYGTNPPVGTIGAPDKLPKKVLYSPREAKRVYEQMQCDIYQKAVHTKKPDKRKFPTVLKIILGTITAASILIFRKDIVKFCKNFSKDLLKK